MKRYLVLFVFILLCSVFSNAQQAVVSGSVIEADSGNPLGKATVQLLKADSAFVCGALTAADGGFCITAPLSGAYIIKVSYLGYRTEYRPVSVSKKGTSGAGRIALSPDAVMLEGAVVTGDVPKVVMVEDTFVYNTAAYRVPEGSTIDALVERLPGAKVDENGKITLNGKEVKKIMLDGRDFMRGNMKEAMENLPASIIEKIKSYDEKSDMAKLTGIDDGEESTVLDFTVKRGMKRGLYTNADLGYGTSDRYFGRVNLSRFVGDFRHTVMANANNAANRNIRSGGRGRNGLSSRKTAGLNFNYEKRGKLKADGSVTWTHGDNDSRTVSSVESFVNTRGAFSNSMNTNVSRNNSWNGNMRLEWKPDTVQTITFRPQFNVSSNDGLGSGASASFSENPYLYTANPLGEEDIAMMAEDSIVVNSRTNKSLNYGKATSFGASLQYHRRLGYKGRNFGVTASFNISDNTNKSLSASNVHLFQKKNMVGEDSTYQTNRYNLTPADNRSYSLQATYTEPLFKATFLQLNYRFQYSHRKSDRSTFDFGTMDYARFSDVLTKYRDWDGYFALLENPLESYLDHDLSRYSEYNNYTHDINIQLRIAQKKYNMNVGVHIQPQRSYFIQNYHGIDVDTVRNVTNITPTLNFRYRFSRRTSLRATYRGTTAQPSISQMLDITDNSNPLNISMGNPGLKPSFTSNLRAEFNTSSPRYQRSITSSIDFTTTRNSISNLVSYDETTGGRITRPENINGNWRSAARFGFNTALDTTGVWTVSTHTWFNYSNYVSYITTDRKSNSQKNITRTSTYSEDLTFGYDKDWLEIELHGSVDYNHSRNMLRSTANRDTWDFAYGANLTLEAKWNMSLTTGIHQTSRRGYSSKDMNTDELIWNMQLSQSFLRRKALTVSLQWFDILRRQSSFRRQINATRRSDTEYNSINSYAMLHVIYKMNMFGGRSANRGLGSNRSGGGNRGARTGGMRGGRGGMEM